MNHPQQRGKQPWLEFTLVGGYKLSVEPPPTEGDDRMPINPAWTWLSPLTYRVVRLLCDTGWITREEIANRVGELPDGKLGPLLADLVERCVLESSPRKGYHLAIPNEAKPEDYRKQLLVWLDTNKPSCE